MLESHLASVPGTGSGSGLPAAGRAAPTGAGSCAGDPGLACDAHPAHACGHESEPERKRPHPAGRSSQGAGAAAAGGLRSPLLAAARGERLHLRCRQGHLGLTALPLPPWMGLQRQLTACPTAPACFGAAGAAAGPEQAQSHGHRAHWGGREL